MHTQAHQSTQSQRKLRVGEVIRKILSEMFMRGDFDAPLLASRQVRISEVRIPADLRVARVYISTPADEDAIIAVALLNNIAARLRRDMGRKLHLKYVPQLVFVADGSGSTAGHIDRLLESDNVRRDLTHNLSSDDAS